MYTWIVKKEHIEYWFKWIEWVTLTAAVSAAAWKSGSLWVYSIAIISGLYVWHSAMTGVGYAFWTGVFSKFNPSENVRQAINYILGGIISYWAIYVLAMLFIGLFRAECAT